MSCKLFITASIQRTGSTLLTGSLNSHPQIKCLSELFMDNNFDKIVGSYQGYIRRSFLNRLMGTFWKNRSIKIFLDELGTKPKNLFKTETQRRQCTHIGFKLMLNHARNYPAILRYARSHDMAFIHLVRKNLLKTEISRVRNQVSKIPHLFVKDKNAKRYRLPRVFLDPGSLIARLDRIDGQNKAWQQELAKSRSMTVYYEDLAKDPLAEINRIHIFFDLDKIEQLIIPTRKMSPASLAQAVENYDEVVATLRGTPYEPFLLSDNNL